VGGLRVRGLLLLDEDLGTAAPEVAHPDTGGVSAMEGLNVGQEHGLGRYVVGVVDIRPVVVRALDGARVGGRVQAEDGVDVALAEAVPLPHVHRSHDRRVAALGEGELPVVHDGVVVVAADVVRALVPAEVVLLSALDLVPLDVDVGVAVRAALLVPDADGVGDLVDRGARAAPRRQADPLSAALPAHVGPAAAAREEADVVVLSVAFDEPDRGVLLPVVDGVGDPVLVGHAGGDLVRHHPVRPEGAGPGPGHGMNRALRGIRGLGVGELVGGPEDDVTLGDRHPVDDLDGLELGPQDRNVDPDVAELFDFGFGIELLDLHGASPSCPGAGRRASVASGAGGHGPPGTGGRRVHTRGR